MVKRIVQADREMCRGNWAIRYADSGITVLRGSTCGIVGYGAVGRELARLARAFDMRVLAIRRTSDGVTGGPGDLLRLLEQSDAIFLSVPPDLRDERDDWGARTGADEARRRAHQHRAW